MSPNNEGDHRDAVQYETSYPIPRIKLFEWRVFIDTRLASLVRLIAQVLYLF